MPGHNFGVGCAALGGLGRRPQLLEDMDVRREFEANFYGPSNVARAIAPVIETNGGGHILNVHSVVVWIAVAGSYSAAKAALWSHTNSLQLDLAPRRIGVTGLHAGYIDTDMAAHVDVPKSSPQSVAAQSTDGIESADCFPHPGPAGTCPALPPGGCGPARHPAGADRQASPTPRASRPRR